MRNRGWDDRPERADVALALFAAVTKQRLIRRSRICAAPASRIRPAPAWRGRPSRPRLFARATQSVLGAFALAALAVQGERDHRSCWWLVAWSVPPEGVVCARQGPARALRAGLHDLVDEPGGARPGTHGVGDSLAPPIAASISATTSAVVGVRVTLTFAVAVVGRRRAATLSLKDGGGGGPRMGAEHHPAAAAAGGPGGGTAQRSPSSPLEQQTGSSPVTRRRACEAAPSRRTSRSSSVTS